MTKEIKELKSKYVDQLFTFQDFTVWDFDESDDEIEMNDKLEDAVIQLELPVVAFDGMYEIGHFAGIDNSRVIVYYPDGLDDGILTEYVNYEDIYLECIADILEFIK